MTLRRPIAMLAEPKRMKQPSVTVTPRRMFRRPVSINSRVCGPQTPAKIGDRTSLRLARVEFAG